MSFWRFSLRLTPGGSKTWIWIISGSQLEMRTCRPPWELPFLTSKRLMALLATRRSRTTTPVELRPQMSCLLYTSDAADDLLCVDLGGRRIIKKKKKKKQKEE